MSLLTIIIIAFIAGVFTKVADLVADHGLMLPKFVSYSIGIAYGIFIGTLISDTDLLGNVWMGALVGVFLAGKFDHVIHKLGLASIVIVIVIGHIQTPTIYAIFACITAFLDEKMSDFIDRDVVKAYFEKFLFLEGYCIFLSVLTRDWKIALSILSFDLAYFFVTKWFIVIRSGEYNETCTSV